MSLNYEGQGWPNIDWMESKKTILNGMVVKKLRYKEQNAIKDIE